MSIVIKVENVGKSYVLRHLQKESYMTLRDVLVRNTKVIVNSKKEKFPDQETFWALKDISFDVEQGDRIGIIGRNGSGKSTLLKVLSRITTQTSGRVSIKGRIASLLEVGTGFHPELTGRENIFLNGSILGMSKAEIVSKFDEIVAFAEVERFLDTPVKRYSSGMYVRLAFAVAAHLEPEILIVDEVLAVGDTLFQKKCLGKMEEVSKVGGRTVLFVSHNMQAVQKLCKKGLLLNKGNLMAYDQIDKVVSKYLESTEASQAIYPIPKPDNSDELAGFATSLQIEDRSGRLLSEIPVGEKWQVRLSFRLRRKTEHFVIALGLVTSFELPLQTSWSAPQTLEAGEYEAVFSNDDVQLTSGHYRLVVGLSSFGRVIHYNENAGRLVISDAGDVALNPRIVNTQSGLLLNIMEISINRK
ncbi:MAG: ATP-binding cassette domain-containing protein [Bacteroidetes bacterium]|nr:ATP-binding cassette domain-containing protein [Bacteroidota bacterium]